MENRLTRRAFAQRGAMAAAALAAARGAWGEALQMQVGAPQATAMPLNYNGLSYETAQLSDPQFFDAGNTQLVSLFRRLSPQGVLRIGGNSSEFCWWKTSAAQQPPAPPATQNDKANYMPHHYTAIGPDAVRNLAGFLDSAGWSCIYGLNLGTGTPARAAEEAAFVTQTLGHRLACLQIGNEPEFYRDANNGLRGVGRDFDTYFAQWLTFAKAVLARVPSAKFGGPDVGSDTNWVVRFAAQATRALPGRIVAATGHYYAEGPPDSPDATMARLLAPSPRVTSSVSQMVAAARAAGIVYRMTEGNTCFRGGKPGVSNAFGSALWAVDYMLTLATLGAAGVNLHGGSSSVIRLSLGGHLPGAELSPQAAQAAAEGSYYTPIAGSRATGFMARPVFYGMCIAQALAGAQLRPVDLAAAPERCTAYAGDMPEGRTRLVILNKSATTPVALAVRSTVDAELFRLTAPALDATAGVLLDGGPIRPGPEAATRAQQSLRTRGGSVVIQLPEASAAVVTFSGRLPE